MEQTKDGLTVNNGREKAYIGPRGSKAKNLLVFECTGATERAPLTRDFFSILIVKL